MVSIIELEIEGDLKVDQTIGLDPVFSTKLSVILSKAENCTIEEKKWMEKFGEWKHISQAQDWNLKSKVSWEVDVMEPGYYKVDLNYAGNGRLVWRIESDEGAIVQNQQNSSSIYKYFEMGLLKFDTPGKHTVSVSLIEGDKEVASLKEIRFTSLKNLE